MNRLEAALKRIGHDLDEIGVPWAVVGGLAVSVLGEPRLTRDVDVAVDAGSDREAERLIRELRLRGYEPVAIVEHEATGRLATARLLPSSEPWRVAPFEVEAGEAHEDGAARRSNQRGGTLPLASPTGFVFF